MAKTKSKQSETGPAAAAAEVCTPPTWFRIMRWACFAATVGIATGMLALLNGQLAGIPWTYDGSAKQYFGRAVTIQYCMFSGSTDASQESRCQFGFGVASVSLVLSFVWSYLQTLRRNPFKHPKAKLADLVITGTWLLLWLAAAIILCVWADQANKVGSFLEPATNPRNGLCVMAWLMFLLVALLTATAGLLYTKKCQNVFNKWEDQAKERKCAHEQKRLEGKQAKVAEAEMKAVAAKQALQTPGSNNTPGAAAVAGGSGPAAASNAAGVRAGPAGAVGRSDGHAAAAGAGGGGASKALPVSSKGPAAAADDNPFRG